MKLKEFINQYANSQVDFDKRYGAQCVDLFRQYCKDVLGIPHTGGVEGAKDLYLNYKSMPLEQKYFDQYKYENKVFRYASNNSDYALSDVRYGDVIIWNKTETNPYGHVAVAVAKINDNEVLVFEQQGYSKTGKDRALLNTRTFDNCLGVLRFKSEVR